MNCEGLLDEYALACFERGGRKRGVCIVAGGNKDRVDPGLNEYVL